MMPPQQLPTPECLQTKASLYYKLGLNVVPIHLEPFKPGTIEPVDETKHKQPMFSWKDLQTRRQTPEEFGRIKFDSYVNGFAIICGQQLENGYYVGVVDYDTKKLPPEIVEKGNEIRKQFPTTQTEQTGSKGIHLVYFSKTQVKHDGDYHDIAALELLGKSLDKDKCHLCIMAPSYGYTTINDNPPSELEDLTTTFYQLLDKNGVTVQKEIDQQEEKAQRSLFKIEKLIDLTKLTKISDNEYQGCHPYHDSSTEKNFTVNTQTDSWYCFRHGTGGGPLQLLAVKEGILSCEDVKSGAIKGAKYRKVIQLAVTEGLIDQESLQQVEINPILLAKDIMTEYSFIVEDESNTLYYFDKNQGIYSQKTERLIKREIARYLDENTRARYYAEVENFIISTAPIKSLSNSPELIACQNGILDVTTGKLCNFNPEYFITTKIPIKYDSSAVCPKIEKFLSEILDEPQRILAQEFIGYCLYREYPFHKAYIANGTGSNGKTVHQNLNTSLLGQENLSNQTIQNINHNRFSCAELHNKLGNFCDDLPSNLVRAVGNFKMATGGGILSAERKGKDPFNFKNKAKFWLNCNDIPPITKTDDNDAYFRRIIINDYKRKFSDKEANKNLINELTTEEELSGYLNYAIAGLQRILKQGHFSEVMTLEETRTAYIKRSDSRQFYLEKYTQETDNPDDVIYHSDLFRDYAKVCHEEGLKIKKPGDLAKAMPDSRPGAEHTKIRPLDQPKGNPVSAWRYLKIIGSQASQLTLTDSVPSVPDVPLSNNSPYPTQISVADGSTLGKICEKSNQDFSGYDQVKGSGTSGTVGTGFTKVTLSEEAVEAFREVKETTNEACSIAKATSPKINPEVSKQRYCSVECSNYNLVSCPYFVQKLPKDHPLPLKCYGFKAPNPGEDCY